MLKSLATAGAAACVLSLAAFGAQAADHPDFTGLWKAPAFTAALKTDKGAVPPLRPEAKALYEQRVADLAPYPVLMLQANGQLDMIQEANHTTRLVYIGQPPVDGDDPKWLGDSTGHWQGQSLVVDTINNDHRTWLDKAGLPHSDEMKVTERLSLSDDGKVLTDAITITDPKTYTAPWTTTVRFRRVPGPLELKENVCTRDHRM